MTVNLSDCRSSATSAYFSSSLRFKLNLRNRPSAVAELVALDTDLLQQRQVEIRNRRFLWQHEVLAAEFHFAVPAANQDVRLRIVVVQVTIAHVRAEQKNGVVEQCSLPVRRRR